MDEPRPEADFLEPQTAPPILCPECGEAIDPSAISGAVVECPRCGAQFFPPVPEGDEELSEDEREHQETKASQEAELSALKIRQYVSLTRGAYRTRSYFIVGTIGCLWVIPPLLVFAWEYLHDRHGINIWSILYFLLAIAAWIGAVKFGRRIIDVQREINASRRARELQELEAARHEPDLSQLSDGSQHARNLDKMFQIPPGDPAPRD